MKKETRNRFRYGFSEGSDSESDATATRSGPYARHRSEPARRSNRSTGRKKSASEKDDTIRRLETEIRRLKVGKSRSPEVRRGPQLKPQRPNGRERTV